MSVKLSGRGLPFTDAQREDLQDLAEADLPVNEIAIALLEIDKEVAQE